MYTDAYNHSYIWCAKTESTAYFVNNGTLFYFTDFIGDRDSILFRFHLAAQRILLSSEDGLKVNDRLSVDTVFGGPKKAALDAVGGLGDQGPEHEVSTAIIIGQGVHAAAGCRVLRGAKPDQVRHLDLVDPPVLVALVDELGVESPWCLGVV